MWRLRTDRTGRIRRPRPSPFDSGHRKRLKSKPFHRAEVRENDLNLRGLEIFEETSGVAFSEIHTHPK